MTLKDLEIGKTAVVTVVGGEGACMIIKFAQGTNQRNANNV